MLKELSDICKSIPWKSIMKEISRIPQWLKNLLLVAIVCGTCYFGYTKCFSDNNLEIL